MFLYRLQNNEAYVQAFSADASSRNGGYLTAIQEGHYQLFRSVCAVVFLT